MLTPIVLVHGGGHGAWCWEPTRTQLRARTLAVDLPPVSMRRGPDRFAVPPGTEDLRLADWAQTVLEAADAEGFDRFVLVGHSLGGLTLGETARTAPERVAHLVFVSALVPPEGKNAVEALPPAFIERVANGLTDDLVREMFCNDMDEEQTRFVLAQVGGDVVQIMTEPVTRAGIPPSMPKTYVRLGRDNGLPIAAQDASIAELGPGVDVIDLDVGHNVMISRPDLLAPILDRLAESS
jgi:pimeloyl-ACP methyl ester carboxylesterase